MNEILRPYATFATIFDSERKVKRRFLRPYGRGATRRQKVTILKNRMVRNIQNKIGEDKPLLRAT
jgi:hypothetical protein